MTPVIPSPWTAPANLFLKLGGILNQDTCVGKLTRHLFVLQSSSIITLQEIQFQGALLTIDVTLDESAKQRAYAVCLKENFQVQNLQATFQSSFETSNLNNLHSLEVVDRVSETQPQVGENSN